jgi:tetraacyldisaccharide 4'-kinase
MKDRKVFCFCGLADPESFRDTAASTGAVITGMKVFRDHHLYRQSDIETIVQECKASGASWIIATGKDMVKLRNLDLPENILIIEMAFAAGQPFYESVFS